MNLKKSLKIVSISAVALFCLTGCVSLCLLDFALSPKNRGKNLDGSWEYMYQTYPHIQPWADSLKQVEALKDTFIYAPDGARLHAYYVAAQQETSHTAVIVHGYTDNAIRMLMIGYLYHHDLGFNILLPDLRYSGQSDGDAFQMGWLDRLDVLQWMNVAHNTFGRNTQMVVHGISMGAATTMMVSGEPQKEYVKCFVEDCGYTSVWDEFTNELRRMSGLPPFPILHLSSTLCKWNYGWSFKEASALNQVRKCQLPMLFIHGSNDDFVPTWMVHPLFEAKQEPKELWIVPDAQPQHARSYLYNREEYTQKVNQFIQKYIQ